MIQENLTSTILDVTMKLKKRQQGSAASTIELTG